MKSPPALHAPRVMANIGRRNIKPSFEWSDEQICCTADYQIPANSVFSDVTEIDLIHDDDVTRPERQYGSCSHAQIQDGRK